MRLPLKTEYACQVLAQLAARYDLPGVQQVDDLAVAEHLSPNYLVQILTTLRQAGIVISRRGKKGGYVLARHPMEISLAEIAIAMEGEMLIESSPGNKGQSASRVRDAWVRANEALMDECRIITLADMMPLPQEGVDWVI